VGSERSGEQQAFRLIGQRGDFVLTETKGEQLLSSNIELHFGLRGEIARP
jgi:hypothetical protein